MALTDGVRTPLLVLGCHGIHPLPLGAGCKELVHLVRPGLRGRPHGVIEHRPDQRRLTHVRGGRVC